MFGRKGDERAWIASQRVLACAGVGAVPDRPTLAVVVRIRDDYPGKGTKAYVGFPPFVGEHAVWIPWLWPRVGTHVAVVGHWWPDVEETHHREIVFMVDQLLAVADTETLRRRSGTSGARIVGPLADPRLSRRDLHDFSTPRKRRGYERQRRTG